MTAGAVLACAAELRAVGGPERAQWSSTQLAGCAVAVTDVAVRDVLWLALDAGPEQACGVEQLALQIGTRCPGRYVAAGLFLFAWSRWRAGDGVLAAEAAQRAVTAAGGEYVAAELLLHAVSMGLNPVTTPRLEPGGDCADRREL